MKIILRGVLGKRGFLSYLNGRLIARKKKRITSLDANTAQVKRIKLGSVASGEESVHQLHQNPPTDEVTSEDKKPLEDGELDDFSSKKPTRTRVLSKKRKR